VFRDRTFPAFRKVIAAWHVYWTDHFRKNRTSYVSQTPEEGPWENPYLPYSRIIIEQILKQRNLDYRTFRPILIDTDSPGQIFGEEDDVDQVLSQLEQGLNFLEICTDRPDYFADWKNCMEEEYGLIVRIIGKSWECPLYGNMVLDFERNQPMWMARFAEDVMYLPFQKQKWYVQTEEKPDEKSGTYILDINVPIGYNRIIVKAEALRVSTGGADK